MNRKDFFSEMNKGLLDTLKAISEPFVEEKLNQLDHITDELLQIEWVVVTENLDSLRDSQSTIISGRNIVFVQLEGKKMAFEGDCPTCKHLLMYTWDRNLKCYLCDQTYDLKENENSNLLKRYPLRKNENGYLIGFYK